MKERCKKKKVVAAKKENVKVRLRWKW